MSRYNIYSLVFMTVKERRDNYYFLGMTNSDVQRVFIPSLNKSFSYSEVCLGESLTTDYVATTRASKAVSHEYDGDDFYYQVRHDLSKAEIAKIEKHRNTPEKKKKVDRRFFR